MEDVTSSQSALIGLLFRFTADWNGYDFGAASRADNVALYLLCGAGLIELRMRGRAWGQKTALDFEAIVSGVWIDEDRKSLLPDELRRCVPAWANERVAVQLQPEFEVRLTAFGEENQRQIGDDPTTSTLFPAFVAKHPVRGRVTLRLLGNEGPSPGAAPLDIVQGGPTDPLDDPSDDLPDVEGNEEASPEKPYRHKRWPGWEHWHNWGIGIDRRGIWHIFHYKRSGDAHSYFFWYHHRRARMQFADGRMEELARVFATRGIVPVEGPDQLKLLKPTISRLRTAIKEAIDAEGLTPPGNPILPPTKNRASWVAAVKFGTVEMRDRHYKFVPAGEP
jgi:hypothetical protein